MKKVFCLYRGIDGADIKRQQDECREYAVQQGWKIKKEFCEFKYNMREDTDSLIDLRNAAEREYFNVLLVSECKNIGRIEEESSLVVAWLENIGVEVVSVSEDTEDYLELGKIIFKDCSPKEL